MQVEEELSQSSKWARNFIIIITKKNFKLTRDQKQALIKKFKPKDNKIKVREDDNEKKIFLKGCNSSFDSQYVQENARKILKDKGMVIVKLTKQDVKTLSPYDTQDSNSQSSEAQNEQKIKNYVALNLEMLNHKKKSDILKAQIINKMENGLKLIEIFDDYPELSDQQMIGEFWGKLEEYERMLSKKNQRMLQINQINDNANDQLQAIEMEQEQIQNEPELIQNEKIFVENQERIEKIVGDKNEIHQKIDGVFLEDADNDLNEEKKDQKLGLIKKAIKKTPIKNNVESVKELAGFDKFMEKQNQAKDLKQAKKINKWELMKKQKEEAELAKFEKLKEQNKKNEITFQK